MAQKIYGDRDSVRGMLHPQKFVAACSLQILFFLACRLAEVPVIFALCKHTISNSCVGLCALLNVVVPIVWQQYGWTSQENVKRFALHA